MQVCEGFVVGAGNLFWILDSYRHLKQLGADVCLSGKHGNYALSGTGLPHLLPLYHPYYTQRPRRIISRLIKPFRKPQQEEPFTHAYISAEVITPDLQKREALEILHNQAFDNQQPLIECYWLHY